MNKLKFLLLLFCTVAISNPSFAQNKNSIAVMFDSIQKQFDSLSNFAQQKYNENIDLNTLVTKKENEIIQLSNKVSILESQLNEHKEYNESQEWFLGIFIIITIVAMFSLIMLFTTLKEKKRIFKKLEEKNQLINTQILEINQHHKEVTDSIKYAKKIQEAILPSQSDIKSLLPDSFIYFRPKDIVSGDFYWLTEKEGRIYFATADCTGHGVPGALMSMLGVSFLNEIVNKNEVTKPSEILDNLKFSIIDSLSKTDQSEGRKDGMDISLYCIDKEKMQLTYSAANNGLYIIRDSQLLKLNPDKQPVGANPLQHLNFNEHIFDLKKNDLIITYSDGFADQFGGKLGKKFKYKQLQDLLIEIEKKPIQQAALLVDKVFENWKGKLEQVDDVLLVGVRV